ncbi:MAG: amino acid ABC transporter permease [Desulfobacteraceae bacterium]|nr:amino acid ABC transporter permease [Desulfobacteraceae bacterium]
MIAHYLQRLVEIFPFFLKGLWMTVAVSGLSLILSTIFGFLLGTLRAGNSRILSGVIGIYVSFIRGTPFVVQIFIVFFIFPEWGIQLDAFPAAIISLSVLGTAFLCEIVAGGIKAVEKGQWEAAASSGLGPIQQLRLVILPQAMQTILPPLVGQYVLLIKDSSVVSVIGVIELTRVGWMTVVRIPEGLMVFTLVGILYFSISYPLIRLSNNLERRMAVEQVRL